MSNADPALAAIEAELAAANQELAWELAKAAADAAGVIDPTPISDGVSAAMSMAEGDVVGAGLSLISMVPYLGDAVAKPVKAGRAASRLAKLTKKIAGLAAKAKKLKTGQNAAETAKTTTRAAKKQSKKASQAKPECGPPKPRRPTRKPKGGTGKAEKGTTPDPNEPPPNLSPPGAGRRGALRKAKRDNGVPASKQPDRILPNRDKRGEIQPGRVYEYDVPAPGGGTKTVRIRDDADGHFYGPGDPQNRGPHFNDMNEGHYDY